MPDQKKPKNERKRVTNLRVGEISFVDRPAVPQAKILIFKRKGGNDAMPNETVKDQLEKIGVCDECIEKVGDRFGYEDNGMRQGENAMEALRRNTSLLVSLRRNFPRQIRELVMALDMAIDDFSRRQEEVDKAGHRDEDKDKDKKKADHPDCPEGMVYDPAKDKCVPAGKAKKEETKKAECPPGMFFGEEAQDFVMKAAEDITLEELAKIADVPEEVLKQAKGIQFVIGRLKGETTTTVQSVLFDKEQWTAAQAKTFLSEHDFNSGSLDETDDRLRFRQRDPDDFQAGSFRTIAAGERRKDKKEVKKESEGAEKGKKVGCPEGMVFDEAEGKCVPDRTNTPRRKSAGDTDLEPTATVDGLGLTEEEKTRLGKLVAGEKK